MTLSGHSFAVWAVAMLPEVIESNHDKYNYELFNPGWNNGDGKRRQVDQAVEGWREHPHLVWAHRRRQEPGGDLQRRVPLCQ